MVGLMINIELPTTNQALLDLFIEGVHKETNVPFTHFVGPHPLYSNVTLTLSDSEYNQKLLNQVYDDIFDKEFFLSRQLSVEQLSDHFLKNQSPASEYNDEELLSQLLHNHSHL